MKISKRMSGLLKLSVVMVAALLCVSLAVASFAGSAVANAESLTISQGSTATLDKTGKIMSLRFTSAADWKSGYEVKYDSNLSALTTIFDGTKNGSSVTNYGDDGSMHFVHKNKAGSTRTMIITYMQLDTYLQQLAALGALNVQAKMTSANSDVGSITLKAYFESDTPTAAAIDSTNDDSQGNLGTIRDNEDYVFAATSKAGQNLSATGTSFATHAVPSTAKYMLLVIQTKRSYAANLKDGPADFSDISVKFSVDASKLAGNITYMEQTVPGNTFANVTSISVNAKGANTPYGLTAPDTKTEIGAGFYTVSGTTAAMADLLFEGKTSKGVEVKGAMLCPTGMGSVVSGGTVTEKITFAFDGGAEKTLAEAISDGYVSSNSANTWGDYATTVNFNWTFSKNTNVVVRFYNLKGDALTWNITLTGIDTDAPQTPVFAANASDWYTSDQAIDLFDVSSSSAENGVTYLYQYAYSAASFEAIDESTLTLKRSSRTTTEVKAENLTGTALSFSFPKGSGYYKVKAVAVDGAGNCSAETPVYNLKLDKDVPVANIKVTTSDGANYPDGEWVNKDVSITFVRLRQTVSGTTFMYSVDGGATWDAANTVTEGDVLAVTVPSGSYKSFEYKFKAVKGTGEEVEVGDELYRINVDKKIPELPTITAFDDYLVSKGFNWLTDGWTMPVSFDYSDEGLGLGDGVMLYYTVTERGGTLIGSEEYALNPTDNRVVFDFSGSTMGGTRKITLYVVDQAGNRSASDLVIEFLADANVYTIGAEAEMNALTGENGGRIVTDKADRKYRRNDVVSGRIVADAGYRFFAEDFDYVYGGKTVSLTADGEFTVDLFKEDVTADPSEISFAASFRLLVTPVAENASLVYNGAAQVPVLKDAGGRAIDDLYAYAANDLSSVSGLNTGDYSFTLTYKNNKDVFFTDTEIAFSVVPAALTVIPGGGQWKTYGEADPSALTFDVEGLVGSNVLDASSVLLRASGENVGFYAYDVSGIIVTDGNGGKNYVVTLADQAAEFEIVKREITLKPETYSVTYSAETLYVSAVFAGGSMAAGDDVSGLNVKFLIGENAGEYLPVPVTKSGDSTDVAGASENANYLISFDVSKKVVITPRTVNFTVENVKVKYGDAEAKPTVSASDALITEKDYVVSVIEREAGTDVGQYSYVRAEIEILSANFVLGTVDVVSGKYEIEKKDLVVKVENEARYGDDFTAILTFEGLVSGETIPEEYTSYHAGILTAVGIVDVLTDEFAANVSAALSNYNVDLSAAKKITVLPRRVTAKIGRNVLVEELTGNPVTSDPASIGLTFENLVEGGPETSAVTLTYKDETGATVTPGGEGFFKVIVSGLPAEYELVGEVTLVIGKGKIVEISLKTSGKIYDGKAVDVASVLALTADGAEFAAADGEVTVSLVGATEIRNSGSYVVSVIVKRAATETEPAYFGSAELTYVVEKAKVVLTVAGANRVYGDNVPTVLDYTVSGLAEGHNLAAELAGFDEVNAGSYVISVVSAVATDENGEDVSANYDVSLQNAEYVVEKAVLNVRFASGKAEYGALRPAVSFTFDGFRNGDDVSSVTVGTATVKSDLAILVPGVYTEVETKGFAAENYEIVFVTEGFEFVVGRKVVHITSKDAYASEREYNGTDAAEGGIDVSPYVVGTDDVSVSASVRFDSVNSGSRKVLFENIKLVGANADYYELISDSVITLDGVVISKYVWTVNASTFDVQIAGKVYDGTDAIPAGSITGAEAGIPDLFKKSGVKITVTGVYDNKNAGTDRTAVLTVSVALENWALNVDFVEDGTVERLTSDKNKVTFRFTKSGLEITKRELVLKSVKANDMVFSGKSALDYLKFSYTFEENKGIASGDIVFLDVSGVLDDVNVGRSTATYTVNGLRTAGSWANYVLNIEDNAAFLDTELSNEINVTPLELILGVKLEEGRIYTGADDNTIGIESASLSWGADGGTGINLNDAFIWNREVVAMFADGTGNVLLDNRGNPAQKRVVISGIALTQTDAVAADSVLSADPKYDVSNYVILGVSGGVYYTEALISPKNISIESGKIVLNDKFYDKTTDGSISFQPNAIEGIVESDKGLVEPKSVVKWNGTEAGENTAYVDIIGLVGERAANYVLSETISGMIMSGNIKPAEVRIDEVVFEDKNYDGTTSATFARASISGVYDGDRVELEVYDYAFVSSDVAYVSEGVYNKIKVIGKARLKDGSNRNYSLYDGGVEADFVTVEESATIYPYVLSFGRKDIKIDPIVYELSFLDLDPSQPMDIDKNNYRISYETLPGGEKIEIRFLSARYMSVAVGSSISCEFVVEGIYSDNRINRNYVLNGSNVITCGARIRPAEVEIAVAGTGYEVEYGSVFDVSKVGIDYTVNGVRLASTSAEYRKIADIAKTIVVCEQNAKTPVGSASITLSFSASSSFDFSTKPGSVRITPAKLYVSTTDVHVIAGNEVILNEIVYSGFKNGDNQSVLKQTPRLSTEANRFSPVGEYAIVISGGEATNYEFEYDLAAKVIVSQSQVEGSRWKDATEENGKYVKTAKYNYGMAVSMEVITTNVDYKVSYFVYRNDAYGADGEEALAAATEVGKYYIKAVVSHEGSKSQELYGILYITKADLNVEVYGYDSVTYDGRPHSVSGRVNGVQGLEVTVWYLDKSNATARPTKDAPINAGTYSVWAEFDGSANNNYNTAKSVERTFVINKATVSVTVEKDQFIFDGNAKQIVYSVANKDILSEQGVYVAVRYFYGANDSQIVYDPEYPGAANSGEAPYEVGSYVYEITLVGGKEGNYVVKRTTGVGLTGTLIIGQSSVTGGSINKITVTPKSEGTPTIIPVDTELTYVHYASLEEAEKSAGATNIWKAMSEGNVLSADESLIFLTKLAVINNGVESNAFSGPVTVKLQLPAGIAGSNVKLARVNSSGEIIGYVNCTFEGDSVVFETQDLGYYAFVKEAILNTTVVYILLGVLGFLLAAGVMVISLKKAAQYRNMKAIVDAKADIDR